MNARSTLVGLAASIVVLLGNDAFAQDKSADTAFEALAKSYIEKLLEMEPERATWLGDHRFDNRLNDRTKEGVRRSRALAEDTLKALDAIPAERLGRINNIDYRILRTRLEYAIFRIDELREHEWNPLDYNVSNAIYELLARQYAPLAVRLRSVAERLKQVPAAVRAAKDNLGRPPRVHTETAIAQNKGAISLVRDQLGAELANAPEMKGEVEAAQATAIVALEEYGRWLEKELLPRSDGEFRLGDARYRRKLAFSLESDIPKEEILRRAEADLQRTQQELYKVALPLYKRYFPQSQDAALIADERRVVKAVFDRLAAERPTNDTIVALAGESLARTTRFVREKKLVSVPDEPVKTVLMPEFDRGVAIAYCRAAPPLDPKAQTLFSIAPTPRDWSAARVESFFREYNNYMVEDLTIHEAMPGHYLQLAHAAKFKAPTLVRTVFRNGAFIEGWAVYSEQLMADHGYGGPEVRMQQLKMRARAIINAIIDQKIHTAGMTEQEAMRLMMEEGFQEEGEAAGKWRRAVMSSAQLSTYYVGYMEVSDIRRDMEAKAKGRIELRLLHDAMLSFSAPAPKYVREMLGLAIDR
jgi:uncharacterized protein (DUF885 family)